MHAEQRDLADGVKPVRVGRRRDHSRDAQILDAALEVLAEAGYAGMTIDMIATRARAGKATVYRRWASKEEVVLEALSRLKHRQAPPRDQLPDTGTLRGDLLALFKPQSSDEAEYRMKIMAGLASMTSTHAGLDEVVNDTVVTPWADAHRALMQRAADRGEIVGANIDTVCRVVATVAAYRTLIQRKQFDRDFLVEWIDEVVLPALHHGATPP